MSVGEASKKDGMIVYCSQCGAKNMRTELKCVKCDADLRPPSKSKDVPELTRIAMALERNATATERIFLYLIVMTILGILLGVVALAVVY